MLPALRWSSETAANIPKIYSAGTPHYHIFKHLLHLFQRLCSPKSSDTIGDLSNMIFLSTNIAAD
jgi:hypothetical protein